MRELREALAQIRKEFEAANLIHARELEEANRKHARELEEVNREHTRELAEMREKANEGERNGVQSAIVRLTVVSH